MENLQVTIEAFLPIGLRSFLPGTRDIINMKSSILRLKAGVLNSVSVGVYLTWHFPLFLLCSPFHTHIYLLNANSLFIWSFYCRIFLFLSKLALHWLLSRSLERKQHCYKIVGILVCKNAKNEKWSVLKVKRLDNVRHFCGKEEQNELSYHTL